MTTYQPTGPFLAASKGLVNVGLYYYHDNTCGKQEAQNMIIHSATHRREYKRPVNKYHLRFIHPISLFLTLLSTQYRQQRVNFVRTRDRGNENSITSKVLGRNPNFQPELYH